jgi:hypothetical protein
MPLPEADLAAAVDTVRGTTPAEPPPVLPLGNQMGGRRTHRLYSVEDLLNLPDTFDDWIVKDMFPSANRIMVVGKGGTYKSTLIFDLCVAIASGGRMLGHFPVLTPGPVLLISTEGSVFANKKRLVMHIRGYDVDPSVIQGKLTFCQQSFILDDMADANELNHIIGRMRPVLIVMDPLDSFFSGEENSAKETKMFRRVVDALIDNYGCSVLVIHHVGKSDKKDPRGSSSWQGWADTIMLCEKEEHRNPKNPDLDFDSVGVTIRKQRNEAGGHLFTAIPYIDSTWGKVTFDWLNEGSEKRVAGRMMQKKIYQYLCDYGPLTSGLIEDAMPWTKEKTKESLYNLQLLGMADKRGQLTVPVAGRGPKSVQAWRPLRPIKKVDGATQVLRYAQQIEQAELAQMFQAAPGEVVVSRR